MRIGGPSSRQRARDVASATLTSAVIAHNGSLLAVARDAATTHGSTVQTWPARAGTAPTQATPAKRPAFSALGGGGLTFDGIDDAIVLTAPLTSATACAAVVVYTPTAATTGVLLEVGSLYYATNGIGLFFDATGTIIAGTGTLALGNYIQSTRTTPVSARGVLAMTADRAPNPDTVLAVDGRGVVPDAQVGANNGTGAYGSSAGWVGARNNGASVPFSGRVHLAMVVKQGLTLGQLCALTRAAMEASA